MSSNTVPETGCGPQQTVVFVWVGTLCLLPTWYIETETRGGLHERINVHLGWKGQALGVSDC